MAFIGYNVTSSAPLTAQSSPESSAPSSSWFERVFDPTNVQNEYNTWAMRQEQQFNAAQAELDRNFQARQAEIDREWQAEMSNTAYKRMFKQLEEAGINPLYVFHSGPASTPSGAMASGSRASAGRASAGSGTERFLSLLGAALALVGTGISSAAKITAAQTSAVARIGSAALRYNR